MCLNVLGPGMHSGAVSSIANIAAQEAFWNHSGNCWAYHASGVGSGWGWLGARAAGEVDDSEEKHEAKKQPPYQIARKPGRIVGAPGAPQRPRHKEDGNERAFQQEEVPLEIEEGLPGGHERQVAGPEERQANGRGEAPKKEKCEADPEPAQDIDEAAGSENPAERGGLEPGSGAEMLVCQIGRAH